MSRVRFPGVPFDDFFWKRNPTFAKKTTSGLRDINDDDFFWKTGFFLEKRNYVGRKTKNERKLGGVEKTKIVKKEILRLQRKLHLLTNSIKFIFKTFIKNNYLM